MNCLTIANTVTCQVNIATISNGQVLGFYNGVKPGDSITVEYDNATEWNDFVVMAANDDNHISKQDSWLDVVDKSLAAAERFGTLNTTSQTVQLGRMRSAEFVSIRAQA
jgi:hypothetical protein